MSTDSFNQCRTGPRAPTKCMRSEVSRPGKCAVRAYSAQTHAWSGSVTSGHVCRPCMCAFRVVRHSGMCTDWDVCRFGVSDGIYAVRAVRHTERASFRAGAFRGMRFSKAVRFVACTFPAYTLSGVCLHGACAV